MSKTRIGIVITSIWLALALVLLLLKADGSLELNEVGDYVAGVVAPIAFLWFVLGYYQQAEEIRENTRALVSQRDELNRQAQLMSDQSDALDRAAGALLEHVRPYIVCYLKSEGVMIRVVLENTGTRPAQDVSLVFDPPLEDFADSKFVQEPVKAQGYMAPGRRIVTLLSTTMEQLGGADAAQIRSQVTAHYNDTHGATYEETFTLALDILGRAIQQPESSRTHLKAMRDHAKSIAASLKEVQKYISKR